MSDDLPGMWEEADFMGGETDQPTLADRIEPTLADECERLARHREAQGQTGEAALIGRMVEALREAEAENRQLRELLPANLLLWLTIGGTDE